MSKTDLWKGASIRLITAIVFGAIGGYAVYYALSMVFIFGEGMGTDARSREIYAHSHMVVHVFGAACALAIGVFTQSGNAVLRRIAVAAILTCGSYGILNMYGFTSSNRVSVAAAKDAKNTAAERQYKNAREDLAKQIEWLQKTASQEDGRERQRLLKEVDGKRKELSALKAPAPSADSVIADPQASSIAELTDTGTRRWQLALPLIMALLVFFAESFSFVVVGHMLSGAIALFATYYAVVNQAEPKKTQSGSSGSDGGSGGSGKGEPSKVHRLPERPAATVRAEPSTPSKQRSVFYVPATGAPERLSAFDRAYELAMQNPHLSTRALVKEAGKQFSQSTASRVKKSLSSKVHTTVRKFGNGRSYQTPAYN